MAPKPAGKGKRKKKTKEELEEERRLAEEAARLAEEERLRAEEAERQRLAELERQRLELLEQFLAAERARLDVELDELGPLFRQFEHERVRSRNEALEAAEWERFLRCVRVPAPRQRVEVNEFLLRMNESSREEDSRSLEEAFLTCEDCRTMVLETRQALLETRNRVVGSGGPEEEASRKALESDIRELYAIINARIDRFTAAVLHHCDEYANERNEIQLGHVAGTFKWGVWVNTAKNPRLKVRVGVEGEEGGEVRVVEMPQLDVTLDIPKQIALANVALRVQHRSGPAADEFFWRCGNQWMAVGGVLVVDLLALPPGAKKVRGWTLRQVTALASNVQRVPYPIPPAGADPLTWQSEEEPPPMGVTAPLPPDVVLLQEPLQVAWWDEPHQIWNVDGISNVSYDPATNYVSFHTTHLAPLALVMSRTRLLPYKGWNVRPTGGRNGSSAAITLDCGLEDPIVIEVSTRTATLSSPSWPQLQSLRGVAMPPLDLLQALSDRGLHLLPEDRDAPAAGVKAKERATEEAMCKDLALLGGVFLLASSRWNQTAEPDEALARLSEVVDWEEGGRTQPQHVARIFTKEKEDGERRVLAVMRRGAKGVAFSDALDKREEYPRLPGVESVEAVKACGETIFGEVHASVLSLLRGQFVVPGAADNPLALRLCASAEGLELARTTSPLFTATLAQTMLALRLFSFS
ncbi:hypothetical protein VOLCADRAFT_92992 [Volvox carteri f. nagariensis]|uniref:IC97/Casc1 N-terminal domain-containing protein n=1 Tax=Volvox carteri f. nagariensis TaxID=3068 RepID=D8U118_VOLCA|nr:uncharacterized protein VOLCADRAFT_92992 [Volvox carteri f. nagariensis]EFJ46480.1 hypothetical protein VOLCADRAFT_92992 [Volvox carteri f. nagariensis]|eukprot:XP_002952337.1 hypothetical protein VOLCADRAFT_92992 [Volvox carteri f. nagariensis]